MKPAKAAGSATTPVSSMSSARSWRKRAFRRWQDEILPWHDHWLKGVDNRVENDPVMKIWITGENEWHTLINKPPDAFVQMPPGPE